MGYNQSLKITNFMRSFPVAAILMLYLAHCYCLLGQTSIQNQLELKEIATQQSSPDWNARSAIVARVLNGEQHALAEMVDLDPVVAIPVLAHYAKDRSTDAERAAIALTALKRVRGIREYFRPLIARLHTQIGGDFDTEQQFKILALIGTKDAVAATAPSLFDGSKSNNPNPDGDFSVSAIRYQAVFTLMKMKLANSPTNKPFYEANEEDIEKWRNWWLAHKVEYEN